MIVDEGYIKYKSAWTRGRVTHAEAVDLLERWRRPLYESALIGHDEDLGVGYGNISVRCGAPGQFLISGTQTGHIAATDGSHYSLVTEYDLAQNSVSCIGPIQASSEAMTHAAIYELDPGIGGIVHVHSKSLWLEYLDNLPTTDPSIAYGTPGMAHEFKRLYAQTAFGKSGLAVMAGHDAGLISIGVSLEEAATRMLNLASPGQQAQA